MELESVKVLKFNEPESFVIQEVKSKVITENRGIWNCIPTGNSWPDDTSKLLRYWLMNAKEVWYSPMDKKCGILFFRDPQDRIINVKKMIVEMKMGKSASFLLQKQENTRLGKLMQQWVDLHELTIDYAEFKSFKEEPIAIPVPIPVPEQKIIIKSVDIFNGKLPVNDVPELPEDVPMDDVPDVQEENPQHAQNHYKFHSGKDSLFVYGKRHPPFYRSLAEVPINPTLKGIVNMSGDFPFQLQVWSQILTGGDVIAIEPPKIRTFIFEPVIYEQVQSQLTAKKSRTGPLVVIVTDRRAAAENLINYFDLMNKGFTNQVRVNLLLDLHDEEEQEEIESKSSCDVLITTLGMIKSLLDMRVDGFDLHTVKTLVVQNIHNMIVHDEKSMISMLQYFTPLHKKQVIAVSAFWHPRLKKLFTDMRNPIICFGSPVEVALKEKTDIVLKMAKDQTEQLSHLMEIVNQSVVVKARIAIVCTSPHDVQIVQRELEQSSCSFYTLGETPQPARILLMTDKLLQSMNVDTVDVLIHFSLCRWASFSNRFLLFEDHFLRKFTTKSYLLLNISEYDNFLAELEQLYFRKGPETFREVAKICLELKKRKEQLPENFHREFCEQLSLLGECSRPFTCPNRHTMNESDVPDEYMPVDGQVELRIMSVEAPDHFLAEIIPEKGERALTKMLEFKLNFDTVLDDPQNRVPKEKFTIGDMCVFHVGHYRRGRIYELSVSSLRQSFLIGVQCLETGNKFRLNTSIDKIFELPAELKGYPPQVVDVYLLEIIPIEPQSGWYSQCLNNLKSYMGNFNERKFSAMGRVELCMSNRIYLRTMKVYEKLSNSMRVTSFDIKEFVVEYNFGKYDKKGIEKLKELADEFGLKEKANQLRQLREEEEIVESGEQDAEMDQVAGTAEPKETIHIDENPKDSKVVDNIEVMGGDEFDPDELMAYQEEDDEAQDNGEEWEDDYDEPFEYVAQEQLLDIDDNFSGDEEELLDMWLMMNDCKPVRATQQYPTATIEEIVEDEVDEKAASAKAPEKSLPFLAPDLKYPEIHWSQSDDEIKLRISAVDVLDYEMEVDNDNITLVLEFPNGELRGGVINFFGRIDTECVTADLRGLMIIVTLAKVLPGAKYNWPRLLTTKQSMKWLKFYQNFAEIDNEELDDKYTLMYPDLHSELDETAKVDLNFLS